MDQAAVFRIVGNILLHWAAAVGVASVIVHSRVAWRTSTVGRHLMAYMLAMALVLVLSCIRADIGAGRDTWWFALIRLITFVAVPLVMTQRLWIQITAQRAERTDRRDDDPAEPTT